MGIKINIPVYVDLYFTEEGVGLYVSTEEEGFTEKIFPFNELLDGFFEMYTVPSNPPTMHDDDREKIKEFIDNLFRAIDYLRKLEHDTATFVPKDSMGYRD